MSPSYILVLVLASLSFFYPITNAFSFTTNGTPSQCDNLDISWAGGHAPFQLLIIPAFGVPQNVSIPTTAFSNGQGAFSLPVSLPASQIFVLTMSDATGFGTGGTTQLLTVQPSSGISCNTTGPSLGFSFELNSALQQCRPYVFSDYSTAVQPVTIMGVIPGGQSFVLSPPAGLKTFPWNANVARGTSIMFLMIDALGRQGGSSDVKTVGSSDDSSCLNSQSPSSTSAAPSFTGSVLPTNTASSAPRPTTAAGGTPIGAIAGTVIGALLFLAVVISLTLFFLKKKRDSSVNGGNFRAKSRREQGDVDLTYDPNSQPLGHSYPFSSSSSAALAAASNPYPHSQDDNPFSDTYSPSIANSQFQSSVPPSPYQRFSSTLSQFSPPTHYQPSLYTSNASDAAVDPFNPARSTEMDRYPLYPPHSPGQSTSRDSTSTAQRKAAMAGFSSYTPSRFILHTDVDDAIPQPDEHGIVELPPQYSETRRALTVSNPSELDGHSLPSGEPQRPVSEYGSFYPPT